MDASKHNREDEGQADGERSDIVERIYAKGSLTAKNPYQYECIANAKYYFIPCRTHLEEDGAVFQFDMTGLVPLQDALKGTDEERWDILLQLCEVLENSNMTFSMHPSNLYLDIHGRVRIMERDFRKDGDEQRGLVELKALAFIFFRRNYTFEDILHGGEKFMRKIPELEKINTRSEARGLFTSKVLEAREKRTREMLVMRKRFYYPKMILMYVSVAAVCMLSGWAYRYYHQTWKIEHAALAAQRAYVENDLLTVIESLQKVSVDRMHAHEKYILASAYIRGQVFDAFDKDTKERLLSGLTVRDEKAKLDYWIHVGRGEFDEAISNAMQLSDDQLLLYGYLHKRQDLQKDLVMNGEMKAKQLSDTEAQIKALADKLGIAYQEEQKESEHQEEQTEGTTESGAVETSAASE